MLFFSSASALHSPHLTGDLILCFCTWHPNCTVPGLWLLRQQGAEQDTWMAVRGVTSHYHSTIASQEKTLGWGWLIGAISGFILCLFVCSFLLQRSCVSHKFQFVPYKVTYFSYYWNFDPYQPHLRAGTFPAWSWTHILYLQIHKSQLFET